jgi:hypothetical protein
MYGASLQVEPSETSPEPNALRKEIINNGIIMTPTMSEGFID